MQKIVRVHSYTLEPQIVIQMSAGLPTAYIQYPDVQEDGTIRMSICEVGSKKSKEVCKTYELPWGAIVNALLKENAHLFMDDEYFETVSDRQEAAQAAAGVPFDMIGSPEVSHIGGISESHAVSDEEVYTHLLSIVRKHFITAAKNSDITNKDLALARVSNDLKRMVESLKRHMES